jgi:hypothetical protein
MRIFVSLFSITLFIYSCSGDVKPGQIQKPDTTQKDALELKVEHKRIEIDEAFFNSFRKIKPEAFEVEYKPDNPKTPEGTPIDTNYFEVISDFYKKHSIDLGASAKSSPLYAYYKFDLSKSTIGLILRRMSQYDASALDLMVWNKEKQTFESLLNITDSWGDAGYAQDKKSWLVDFDNDNMIDVITFTNEFEPNDLSGEGDLPGKIVKVVSVYKGDGASFNKIYEEATIDLAKATNDGFKIVKIKNMEKDTTYFDPVYKHKVAVDFDQYKK